MMLYKCLSMLVKIAINITNTPNVISQINLIEIKVGVRGNLSKMENQMGSMVEIIETTKTSK